MDNIKRSAFHSLLWSFVEKLSVQSVSFIVSLILARLLTPEDYGTIAIISIFIVIFTVFVDCGILKALIQKKECTDLDFSTALYSNLLLGLACYGILFLLSPYIARFFDMQDLCSTIRANGLMLVICSLTIVQRAKLQKSFQFRKLAIISFISLIIGATVGIYMAYNGYGVWSLVVYNLVMEAARMSLFWITSSWRPQITFSTASFSHLFGFGTKLLAANILHTVVYNSYTFIIGKLYEASSLGIFNRGQTFATMFPSNMSNVIEQATYPVFSQLQSDIPRLRNSFDKYIWAVFAITSPLCIMLAVLAKPVVLILLTDKWIEIVYFVQVLSFAYMFDPIMRLNSTIMNITGHSEYSLYSEMMKKFCFISIIAGTCLFGIKVMAWGLVLYSIWDIICGTYFVKKVIGLTLFDELKTMLPVFIFSSIMGGIIFIFTLFVNNYYIQIAGGCILGFLAYATLIYVFEREHFNDAKSIFTSIIKR